MLCQCCCAFKSRGISVRLPLRFINPWKGLQCTVKSTYNNAQISCIVGLHFRDFATLSMQRCSQRRKEIEAQRPQAPVSKNKWCAASFKKCYLFYTFNCKKTWKSAKPLLLSTWLGFWDNEANLTFDSGKTRQASLGFWLRRAQTVVQCHNVMRCD